MVRLSAFAKATALEKADTTHVVAIVIIVIVRSVRLEPDLRA